MATLTINQLARLCANAKKLGLGGKKILISDDDEGNGYHELFFGLSKPEDVVRGVNLPFNISEDLAIKDYLILG